MSRDISLGRQYGKDLYDVVADRYPHFLYCFEAIHAVADRYGERKRAQCHGFRRLLVKLAAHLVDIRYP